LTRTSELCPLPFLHALEGSWLGGLSSGHAGDATHRRGESIVQVRSVMFFEHRHHRPSGHPPKFLIVCLGLRLAGVKCRHLV